MLTEGENFRPLIEPTPANGLIAPSRIMVDEISTVAHSKLGKRIGQLTIVDMARVERALGLVLGFAG